jgi:hypothetical protein
LISTLQFFINSCWKHRRLRFKADTRNKIDDLRPHEMWDAELANTWTTKRSLHCFCRTQDNGSY